MIQYVVNQSKIFGANFKLARAGRTYILGNDSDFFLFKDCRYVNFDDVAFVREPRTKDRKNKHRKNKQIIHVAVNVYTRAALAKLMAVSENFLVDFGSGVGWGSENQRSLLLPQGRSLLQSGYIHPTCTVPAGREIP